MVQVVPLSHVLYVYRLDGYVCGTCSKSYFSHTRMSEMLDDAKKRSGLYHFFHLALLNDIASFAY